MIKPTSLVSISRDYGLQCKPRSSTIAPQR